MDNQIQKITPDYRRIYKDLVSSKYEDKQSLCKSILAKSNLSYIDVININKILFGDKEQVFNQKLKAYNENDIMKILLFQKDNNLNNSELSRELKISRNTIAKWRKTFLI